MNMSRRLQPFLQRVVPPLLVLVIIAIFAVVHLRRHYDVSRLSADSLDTVQAARYYAQTGQFGTLVVRPLVTGFMPFRSDGSQPDLGHAPLYTLLAGIAITALHQTAPGSGDMATVLVSLTAWVGSIVAVFLLARRLFFSNQIAALAATLYALASGAGLTLALTPHPATLAALLYPLLFLALASLGKLPGQEKLSHRTAIGASLVAGVLYGLLFQSVYSTIILLPVFVWHIARTVGKAYWARTIPVFVAAFLLVSAPYFLRSFRATRNPLFNARSLELIMNTDSHPGYSLYHSATLNQSVGQYLTSGGYKEVLRKSATNIESYYERIPAVFGILLLPLALGSCLIRFDDSRTNQLRNLLFIALAVQFVGLSFYQAAEENLPLLLMHQAIAAVFGAGFLVALVRARNLPRYLANAAIVGWTIVACVPGLIAWIAARSYQDNEPYDVYLSALATNTTNGARLLPVREGKALLVADSPWQWAFRCDMPTVWLPRDSGDFRQVAERSELPIAAVVLTPELVTDYSSDPASSSWLTTYLRLGALWNVSNPLDVATRRNVISKVKLYYPDDISAALNTYRPEPFAERGGTQYTFLFWSPEYRQVKQ